jgi:hypothetical protein
LELRFPLSQKLRLSEVLYLVRALGIDRPTDRPRIRSRANKDGDHLNLLSVDQSGGHSLHDGLGPAHHDLHPAGRVSDTAVPLWQHDKTITELLLPDRCVKSGALLPVAMGVHGGDGVLAGDLPVGIYTGVFGAE